mgnify:CR=1 FL=1
MFTAKKTNKKERKKKVDKGALWNAFDAEITQEEPIECARRETFEELNLTATSIEWIDSMIFKELNQVILGYVVYGEGSIKCSEELIELKRIPLHKLKSWDFGTGYLVKRFLEQRGVEG